jgi:hypothetical protein
MQRFERAWLGRSVILDLEWHMSMARSLGDFVKHTH